tara:strand:+ start:5571 stop:6104 length:534 start_codon:yes stop_codon:yes gene_type:complete
MPLPTPKSGEKRSKFMSRCMVDPKAKDEFKDVKQRAAVCSSQFKEAESKASVVLGDPINKDDCILFFSEASPDVSKHYFKTKEEALKDAKKMGLKGIHPHESKDGKTLYMAGPDHKTFMKRHDEILEEKKKSDSSLWENIRKKKERIKSGSGEKMRKKGDKGAPTADQIKKAKGDKS